MLATVVRQARPVATWSIAAVCVALYGLGWLWSGGNVTEGFLLRMGADYGPAVRQGEIWRLLASAFLHLNLIHLGMNIFALWALGPFLEVIFGWRRYLILYGVCALGGSLASSLPRDVLSVGASGAIWGLMTAGAGLVLRPRDLLPPQVIARMRARVWGPVLVNLLWSLQPGVDMLGHLGGGALGLALVGSGFLTRGVQPPWTLAERPKQRSEPLIVNALTATLLALMAISLGAAMWFGRPWEAQ